MEVLKDMLKDCSHLFKLIGFFLKLLSLFYVLACFFEKTRFFSTKTFLFFFAWFSTSLMNID